METQKNVLKDLLNRVETIRMAGAREVSEVLFKLVILENEIKSMMKETGDGYMNPREDDSEEDDLE